MLNSELLEKLHRTWVQALINNYWNDYASIIVDAELSFEEKYDQLSVFAQHEKSA